MPEAIFLRVVCGYKGTHTTMSLKAAYKKIAAEYPSSEWTKRVYPYRLM